MSKPRLSTCAGRPARRTRRRTAASRRVMPSRSMRPRCCSQNLRRSNTGTPRSLQSSSGASAAPLDGALAGDDDAPDAAAAQRRRRQRLSIAPRSASRGRHRLEHPPRAPCANCRRRAMRGSGPSTRIRRTNHRSRMMRLKISRLARMQTSHTSSTLDSHSTAWRDRSDVEAAADDQRGRKGKQPGDAGVDQQAAPLDADLRPVEADGCGRDHDRARQHRGEIDGVECRPMLTAPTPDASVQTGAHPARSTSSRSRGTTAPARTDPSTAISSDTKRPRTRVMPVSPGECRRLPSRTEAGRRPANPSSRTLLPAGPGCWSDMHRIEATCPQF